MCCVIHAVGLVGSEKHPSDKACKSQLGSIDSGPVSEGINRWAGEGQERGTGQHILASLLCRGCRRPFAAPQKGPPTTNTLCGQVTRAEGCLCLEGLPLSSHLYGPPGGKGE